VALNPIKPRSNGGSGDDGGNTSSPEDEILIREIDEAVRQDDTQQFFRDYGYKLLAVIVAGLAGLGGYLLWDNYRENRLEAQSEAIVSALDFADANKYADASDKVDGLIDDGSPAAVTAARFIQAGAALELGDKAKAVELFAAIAADSKAPPALRDLARIREVAVNFDERKPADVVARLKDLAVPGNPLFGSAGELTAMAHLEAGNTAEAGKTFALIAKEEGLPDTLRSRARQMAGLLGVDAIVDVEKLLKDEGVVASGSNGEGLPLAN
jgi:hypothetical protein